MAVIKVRWAGFVPWAWPGSSVTPALVRRPAPSRDGRQARKAMEDKAKEINRDQLVREAQAKMEAELDFGAFSFKF